ncbi:MAG: glycosyl hydrolase [Leeuwenhoekiella sp.]
MKYKVTFLILFLAVAGYSQVPVNKNASAEAKTLLKYIYSLNGNILAGQHSYNEKPDQFYNKAEEISGKFPAVWGTDFYWNGQNDPGDRVVKEAINKNKEGAIVTLMWHVGRPMDDAPYGWSTSVQDEITDAQWDELITPGSVLNKRWLAQLDNVATHLKDLQKANVPVLWRPYHEMNGVWFWWGNRKGADGYAKLWQLMYDRFVNYHHLNNLIWVWNANGPRDIPQDEAFAYADFYPGAEYVDILATDVYNNDYEQKDYNELLDLADGKPIALGEVGQLPKTNVLEAQPKWSWFMIWSNWLETANTPEHVKEVYNYSKVLTRDEVNIKK